MSRTAVISRLRNPLVRWRGRAVVLCLLIAGLLAPVTGCNVNPATGKRQLNMLGRAEEIRLGAEAEPQFLESYGSEIPSPIIQEYVSTIGLRLASLSERPDLPWSFHVVDSQVINAFALPGGKVFISRGLLARFNNEAQLAGVLGHEVGHVTAQHIGQQMTQALVIQGVAIGIGIAGETEDKDWLRALGVGTQVGGALYLLKFGRDHESQSDQLGLRYMTRAGYNPVGLLQVMEVLRDASAGQAQQPAILSTHPLAAQRIRDVESRIRKQYPNFEDPAAYNFGFESFKANVVNRLDDLPPPQHNPKRSSQRRGNGGAPVRVAMAD